MTELYIGLMSGTSLDGSDGVLVDFTTTAPGALRVLAHAHRPFTPALTHALLTLNEPGDNELHRAAMAGNALARSYAEVVAALLAQSCISPGQVVAIGAHGQTVRHRPREFDGTGYSVQVNNPALLSELCRIDVIADLRSRDIAAGGQGAPLAPAFHRAVFGRAGEMVAVLNVGGISNLTSLHADGSTFGFDCGPGNALMDHWCSLHTGQQFDDGGRWAASGRVVESLLASMLTDPYFSLQAPKSTGRDLFNPAWLKANLARCHQPLMAPEDVQATLTELTAAVCTADLRRHAASACQVIVCGGGALNAELMRRISMKLPDIAIASSAEVGLGIDQVEACAFAWLARAFMQGEPGNLPSVTGAAGPRVLGARYPR